ncbi:uncharacterized protein BX664DRAFT_265753 [Halteromyces radiatus]|uniref:uncharacterized protein n=1 Tax=Halteromyces radiatus TaxID=101107 RepID=UPI00221F88B2|nr:uncharacterized protein BX664DRAFT_265753 [Halteromyces radiatus]KAI8086301.1 hypothetical protein BX664DRAFT_265753 [Halteromyces radiatus]
MVKREIKEKFPFSGIEKYVEGVFRKHVFDLPLLHDANIYPQVHATMNDWELTSTENAMPYLPSQQDPVKLTLGIHDLTNISLPTFSSTNINKYMRYKRGHIFNTGSNVCSLDFAPKTTLIDSNPLIHFLATGGYKERNELHSFETQQQGYQNCIQLWNCDLNTTRSEDQVSAPHLDLCLLHDFGHVRALKWCPYGAYEENLDSDMDDNSSIPKLGILAACFGDGTVRILVIPHPDILRSRLDINHQEPIYCKFSLL